MPLSFEELTLVYVTVLHVLLTLSLFQVVHKMTLVGIAIVGYHLSISARSIVDELSFIDISIREDQFTITCHFVIEESPFVNILVSPSILSSPLHDSFVHLTFVNVTILKVIFAQTMFPAITSLTLVNPIFIFYRFFLKFQSVSHSFFPEDFLRKVLQLPKDDFKSPFSHFISWNIWKFAISNQNIQFFDSQSSILSSFKLFDSFNALVNIFLPSYYFIHYLLDMVYVVSLVINFSERLDIVLSFLNQQSIS